MSQQCFIKLIGLLDLAEQILLFINIESVVFLCEGYRKCRGNKKCQEYICNPAMHYLITEISLQPLFSKLRETKEDIYLCGLSLLYLISPRPHFVGSKTRNNSRSNMTSYNQHPISTRCDRQIDRQSYIEPITLDSQILKSIASVRSHCNLTTKGPSL